MPLTSPPLMKITLAGLHAPHVPRLQALLGDRHAVEGLENLPASGLIETDVLVTIRLREDEARRLKCSLLQAPGAGLEAIARRAADGAEADDGRPAALSHPVAQLRSLLPEVDVLVLCCPLTQETEGLVGAQELDAMRPDALLVNVGRGPLVQEQALYEALVARRIGRAVLDVWYHYPTAGQTELAPSRFPFHTLPNARCTPHIAGWTQGLLQRRYEFMARNIGRLGRGEALENVVR